MKTSDVSEKGLESLIMLHMTGADGLSVKPDMVAEPPPSYGGTGYFAGSPKDYDRDQAIDVPQLLLMVYSIIRALKLFSGRLPDECAILNGASRRLKPGVEGMRSE